MKIVLAALLAATVATAAESGWSQDLAPPPAERVPAGIPLRVELDHSYRMQVGARIEGHLTEPVYLIDHVVVPAETKVFGTITGKHPVSRQIRMAAMFNGDLTPLKEADVTFNDLQTPDGRHFAIETDATERTTKTVRMATNPSTAPHRSLSQRIAAALQWTKRETTAAFGAPHKWDTAKQTLYAQVPFHPQELWVGTEYDAELKQPLELTGQTVPAPVPAADLSELKLTGAIEARLVDPVGSSTASPGMPVEAVLTQPLFESAPGNAGSVPSVTTEPGSPQAHGKLLLPEGTHLIGSVVQAKPAGMFGHNGSLRLTFRSVELPEGDERVVHGRVTAAEGQVSANGSKSFLAPITLGSLAAVGERTGGGLMREALSSNGLNLLTQVVGTASAQGGLITGFAYYEVGKIVFDTWIARGHEVVFARNTRLEIELSQR